MGHETSDRRFVLYLASYAIVSAGRGRRVSSLGDDDALRGPGPGRAPRHEAHVGSMSRVKDPSWRGVRVAGVIQKVGEAYWATPGLPLCYPSKGRKESEKWGGEGERWVGGNRPCVLPRGH